MQLEIIPADFSVCRIAAPEEIDFSDPYCFIGKTDEELSLVCSAGHIPAHPLAREDGWRAFRVKGPLDFSLIGILSRLTTLLADAKIGIFAVSTYNTDYILTRGDDFPRAISVLQNAGYTITGQFS